MSDYGMYPMRPDMNYGDMERSGQANYDMARNSDMRSMDYRGGDYRGRQMMDGHHYPEHQMGGQTYYPIEAMGRFNGYWGVPEQDYARGRDYGYDMRGGYGRRDYGDYGYQDFGDYGEVLSAEEIEKWTHKLLGEMDEREKQLFNKDTIMQKFKQMGKQMEGFGEKELYVTTLMCYTDYKQTIGQSVDTAIKLAIEWLTDKDVAVRGAEKLAVYYDCIVEGE
jgi:hypothetical protein